MAARSRAESGRRSTERDDHVLLLQLLRCYFHPSPTRIGMGAERHGRGRLRVSSAATARNRCATSRRPAWPRGKNGGYGDRRRRLGHLSTTMDHSPRTRPSGGCLTPRERGSTGPGMMNHAAIVRDAGTTRPRDATATYQSNILDQIPKESESEGATRPPSNHGYRRPNHEGRSRCTPSPK